MSDDKAEELIKEVRRLRKAMEKEPPIVIKLPPVQVQPTTIPPPNGPTYPAWSSLPLWYSGATWCGGGPRIQ